MAFVLFFAAATMTPAARRCVMPRMWFPARKRALEAALKRLLARRKSNSLRDMWALTSAIAAKMTLGGCNGIRCAIAEASAGPYLRRPHLAG